MTLAQSFLAELDQEMPPTRRLLERVPSDKGQWKPHPKSFPLAHLAQLVARMPGWIPNIVQETSLDLSSGANYTFETTETLLQTFDENVKAMRDALAATSDKDFMVEWSLKNGDHVLFSAPRVAVVRQTINHFSHHRGQLTVYLRLLDVPLPSIYGPTADEKW